MEKYKNKKKKVSGFNVLDGECIWMKTGVINFRLCDNAYDCNTCPFDTAMSIAMNKAHGTKREHPYWAKALKRNYNAESRPCRHTLTGRTDAPKNCILNYECYHCSYDQWLDEYDMVERKNKPSYELSSGYRIADNYYYHPGHGWASFGNGGYTRIGFDDFLVRLFGTMDAVSLPNLGEKLKQGQPGCSFSRDDKKAQVLSPISGTVLAVNQKIIDFPEIAHADPYEGGWLCTVEADLPLKNVKKLYYGKEAFHWMEAESQRLMSLLGPEYEQLAATGGKPIGDIYGNFPELEWGQLVRTFLGGRK